MPEKVAPAEKVAAMRILAGDLFPFPSLFLLAARAICEMDAVFSERPIRERELLAACAHH